MSADNLYFFLGGHDLEMTAIRGLLEEFAEGRFCDKALKWGAKASDYRAEITEAISKGMTPVLIELEDDIGLGEEVAVKVDHHGERAGADKPASIEQVFKLLGLPAARWTRRLDLVCVNDKGYIPALVAAGASQEEIIKIRAEDRRAQGITEEESEAGVKAAGGARVSSKGTLTVVNLPHARTAAVTDVMDPALGGKGYVNLLIISPGEVNFFGHGDKVFALDKAFPGGYFGGSLPERGFWWHEASDDSALDFLLRYIGESL